MLTSQDSDYFAKRDALSEAEKITVDQCLDAVLDRMHDNGLTPAGDDRCASVEAAIIRFIIECRTK